MIELVSEERCTACNICVAVCPTNVFEPQPGAPPALARQSDCQTCFMCELYCPEDALYVAPNADAVGDVCERELVAEGRLGGYRAAVGWTKATGVLAYVDASHKLLSQF